MSAPKQPTTRAQLAHPSYRPDVDGLRAVAVLSVVLFHAFPDVVRGGFIGVDIFFVISGYLISSIIMRSLEQGCFSFGEFYARRIRRIFPALALVLISCLALGWFSLLALEFRQLGKHVAAGAGFVSNFVLWGESGYFDDAAETKPLLHLWSLGIEEQYYIVWPLVLWLTWQIRASFLAVTAIACLLSFGWNIAVFRSDAVADFYSPLTRFWELLIGSALAGITMHGAKQAGAAQGRWTQPMKQAQSVLGAACIASALALVTKESHFPGVWALLPVAGTALMISAGSGAWINRAFLSRPAVVWVGLISFPLYLWHWPLLSFARTIESAAAPLGVRVALVAASFVLAWGTYRFVERPIRFGSRSGLKALGLAALMAAVGSAGFAVFSLDGVPERRAAQPIVRYEGDVGRDAYLEYMVQHFKRCANEELRKRSRRDSDYGYRCFQSKPGKEIDIMVIGDSHAEHLLPGLAKAFPERNVASFNQTNVPVIDGPHFSRAFSIVLKDNNIKTVVLVAQWEDKIRPQRRGAQKRLAKTIVELVKAKERVYVFDDVPNYSFHPNRCKYQRAWSFSPSSCEMSIAERSERKARYSPVLAGAVAAASGISIVSMDPFFCSESECSMVQGSEILYRDENHLNVAGSLYLGEKLKTALAQEPQG